MRRVLSNGSGITSLRAAAMTLFALAPPLSARDSGRSLPIFYVPALAVQGFPTPLLKARIAGHEAIFIVDSGASANVFADWYVEVAGIPAVRSDSAAVDKLVDTGATGTTFSDRSKIAQAIGSGSAPGPRSAGVGGEAGGRMVRNVQLLRGGGIVTLNPSIGEVSERCGVQGILGMDALRNCLLILGEKEMAFSCD
jgi:Aspartyl protease